jgi:hypothetical protein
VSGAEVQEVPDGFLVVCPQHNLIRGVETGQHAAKIADDHRIEAHPEETCTVDGCTRQRDALGLCNMHYQRQRTYGSTDERPRLSGSDNPNWKGADASYGAIHRRLVIERGRADSHTCRCGRTAAQWSYTGPRAPGERQPYSDDLSLYQPQCVRCHKRDDLLRIRAIDSVRLDLAAAHVVAMVDVGGAAAQAALAVWSAAVGLAADDALQLAHLLVTEPPIEAHLPPF